MKTGRKQILLFALETYSLIGGIQAFNRRLIRHLGAYASAHGYDPVYIGLLRDKNAEIPALPGVRIEPFGRSRIYFVLKAVINSVFKGDILFIGVINLTAIAFLTKLFNKKIKTILIVHGDDVWNDPRHKNRRKQIYDELFLRSIDRIASVSWYTAHVMSREYGVPLSKFRLLPNATDILEANRGPSPAASPAGKRILTVSRLDAHDGEKNIDKLIQAMVPLTKRDPEILLEIVGDGVLRPKLESMAARLGVDHCIQFHGRLSDADLKAAYARARVFALPSSKEGFGIVYLEAWQFGLPVICSKFGASSEVVSDGVDGFAVDPDNIEELAGKIGLLIEDPDLAVEFAGRGRKKILENYTDVQYAQNLKAILAELETL